MLPIYYFPKFTTKKGQKTDTMLCHATNISSFKETRVLFGIYLAWLLSSCAILLKEILT